MALTTAQYVEKVWYNISKGNPEAKAEVYRTAIEASLPEALQNLAEEIKEESPAKRALLEKTFSFTLASGEASLSANPTLMSETIPISGYVKLTGVTEPLAWVPNRGDLTSTVLPSWLSDYHFYTVQEGKIIVRKYDGTVPSATALTVLGVFVPIISEVPDQLVDDLVEIGVALIVKGETEGGADDSN